MLVLKMKGTMRHGIGWSLESENGISSNTLGKKYSPPDILILAQHDLFWSWSLQD